MVELKLELARVDKPAPIRGTRSKRELDIVSLSPHLSGQKILSSLTDLYGEVAILARGRNAFQALPADYYPMRVLATSVQFEDQSMRFVQGNGEC